MIPLEMKHDPSVGNRFPFRMSSVTIPNNGYLVLPHWHEHLEFIIIVSGRVLVTLDNQSFYASAGDIVYVNSRRIHSVQVTDNDGQTWIKGMIFDRLFVTNLLEGFETRQIYNLFVHTCRNQSLISASHPLWQELNDCIVTADREYAARDIGYEMVIKSCIYRVVTAMLRHYKRHSLPIGTDFNMLRPALEYIEEKFAERLSITEISRVAKMSPSHFSRSFKKMTGLTFTDFLTATRINMAKQMLVAGQHTITEIAEKTGFCNVHYFGKVFKESTGMSPMQFKNDTIRNGLRE
ncbi:helix-turn-helix domain-containing protein [Paenibacillus mesophilus]|uniref:AraC family transcriptional regulator n=1 Tax=Paenibacillus mesophilus TaxID=2582849 RepID=UPI00110EFE22|nr:AraC family transcriptional regulator [Paenibacillus mesophilus]TMV44908.1 helix-turn-helix domain-containing protein [Paenibacillus mesophilus]